MPVINVAIFNNIVTDIKIKIHHVWLSGQVMHNPFYNQRVKKTEWSEFYHNLAE